MHASKMFEPVKPPSLCICGIHVVDARHERLVATGVRWVIVLKVQHVSLQQAGCENLRQISLLFVISNCARMTQVYQATGSTDQAQVGSMSVASSAVLSQDLLETIP